VETGAPGASFFDVGLNVKVEPFTNRRSGRLSPGLSTGAFLQDEPVWTGHSHLPDLASPLLGLLQGSGGEDRYNLDKAAALLKEAGLEKGFECELKTSSKTNQG